MHKIKLVPDKPFHNNCDITVYDVTGDTEKRRCRINVDYAEYDIGLLKEEGKDFEEVMAYFKKWIYEVVKVHIADDWECTEGKEEIEKIIEDHIKGYF